MRFNLPGLCNKKQINNIITNKPENIKLGPFSMFFSFRELSKFNRTAATTFDRLYNLSVLIFLIQISTNNLIRYLNPDYYSTHS